MGIGQSELDKKNFVEEASRLVAELPKLFSDDFDRKTLWERIGNGLIVSCTKSTGDINIFMNNLLSYIKASSGEVACNESIQNFYVLFESRGKEWCNQFIKTIEDMHFLITVKARAIWNNRKETK